MGRGGTPCIFCGKRKAKSCTINSVFDERRRALQTRERLKSPTFERASGRGIEAHPYSGASQRVASCISAGKVVIEDTEWRPIDPETRNCRWTGWPRADHNPRYGMPICSWMATAG